MFSYTYTDTQMYPFNVILTCVRGINSVLHKFNNYYYNDTSTVLTSMLDVIA